MQQSTYITDFTTKNNRIHKLNIHSNNKDKSSINEHLIIIIDSTISRLSESMDEGQMKLKQQ